MDIEAQLSGLGWKWADLGRKMNAERMTEVRKRDRERKRDG